MSTTLTIRADETLREALEARARAQGKTLSGYVREILEGAVADHPVGSLAGHLRGRLRPANGRPPAWNRSLRERNWRP